MREIRIEFNLPYVLPRDLDDENRTTKECTMTILKVIQEAFVSNVMDGTWGDSGDILYVNYSTEDGEVGLYVVLDGLTDDWAERIMVAVKRQMSEFAAADIEYELNVDFSWDDIPNESDEDEEDGIYYTYD